MRTIIYAVFNKDTNERVYNNIDYFKCVEYIKKNENENLEIRYKWIGF